MFSLFKKSFLKSGLLNGFTDVHCHILPGVDDGVQKMGSALRVLEFYEEHGVKRVFFTPHVAEELHENTRDHLLSRLDNLRNEYKGNIELALGAEYMLDNGFEKLLDQNEDFLCASGNTLLVETTAQNPPINMSQIIFELQDRGYDVMLAHPERYTYMHMNDYEDLVSKNVRLQLNLLSIAGLYGEHAKKKGKQLLEKGLYTYVGTDLHNLKRHQEQMEISAYSKNELKAIETLIGNNNQLPIGK
ncbi:MAG: capsular biosynthesis protein [Paludibacteraceae bacterium]|nr:capsular biosynthesis protein [Paludibacteraceae bacterium]